MEQEEEVAESSSGCIDRDLPNNDAIACAPLSPQESF